MKNIPLIPSTLFDTRLHEFNNANQITKETYIGELFTHLTKGTFIGYSELNVPGKNIVHTIMIENPENTLTNLQIAEAMDKDKNLFSQGNIFQDEQYLIITWSALAHL